VAVAGWRRLPLAAGGIALSLGIVAIQLAPALEAAANKVKDAVYGAGLPGGSFFLVNFLLPNYYEHSSRDGRYSLDFEQYLYLGAVALAALFFARPWKPGVAILAACLFFAEDPLRIWTLLAQRSTTIGDALREWNFLAGLFTGFALLAASGAASLRDKAAWPRPITSAAVAAAIAWSARQLWLWNHGAHFANGWASAIEVAITAAIGFTLLRAGHSRVAAAALLLLLWTDYKVYGTSRRFNAVPGARDIQFHDDARAGGREFLGMPTSVWQTLRDNRHFRILYADVEWANEARHYGLLSPQGADPLVPPAYKRYVERFVPFSSNRLFPLDWRNPEMLDSFAVKYVISSQLLEAQHLRLLPETQVFYHKVYEFTAAHPIYRFENGTTRHLIWQPEQRTFEVDSAAGGPFLLLENNAPGWTATIDGTPTAITAEQGTFQRIQIPPGSHRVAFRYRSQALRAGAALTTISLIALALFCLRRRPPLLQS
ncbi:MAG: YfhO family protein, partial [Bryobacterales bacterium]|nr:YfhO family protein [Bryobacterales bacterium]